MSDLNLTGKPTEPTFRDLIRAKRGHGIRSRLNVDEMHHNEITDEDWRHREWLLTNARGRDLGCLTVQKGGYWTHLWFRSRGAGSGEVLSDPTPREILAAAEAVGLTGTAEDLTTRNEQLKAARSLVKGTNLRPRSIEAALLLLEDMVLEVDQVRGEVEAAHAKVEQLLAANDTVSAEAAEQCRAAAARTVQAETERDQARAEAARLDAQIKDLAFWLIERTGEPKGSYGAVDAAKNAITELTAERDKARAIAVELEQQLGEIQHRLGEIALDRERRDVEEFSGESVTAFRTAEECLAVVDDVTDPIPSESFAPARPSVAEHLDVPGPRQAYRDALAVADNALGRWPYDGSPEAQTHRRNLRKLAGQLGDDRPAPTRSSDRPARTS